MSNAYLKQNDTQPTLDVVLTNPAGTPYDPTGGTVKLHVRTIQGLFERAMTIVDGPTGLVRYTGSVLDWVNPGEVVLVPGAWNMECEVTTAGGVIITFPNSGYDVLIVTADLDSEVTVAPPLETGAVLLETGQNTKISALADGAPALSTDQLLVARSGANHRLTVGDVVVLPLQYYQRTFSAAEIAGLGTVPIEILPAIPGVLYASFFAILQKDTVGAFDNIADSTIRVSWNIPALSPLMSVADDFLESATVTGRYQTAVQANLIGEAATELGGKSLIFHRTSGVDRTGAGSPCTLKLWYYKLPSAL